MSKPIGIPRSGDVPDSMGHDYKKLRQKRDRDGLFDFCEMGDAAGYDVEGANPFDLIWDIDSGPGGADSGPLL